MKYSRNFVVMQNNRPVTGGGYTVGNQNPPLVLDFASGVYRTDGHTAQNFSDVVTFTRASSATYFDEQGVLQTAAVDTPRFDHNPATLAPLGLMVEESRTNLLPYSEAFDNAAWTKVNLTVTADATTAPDGTPTAEKVVGTGSGPTIVDTGAISAAGPVTLSVHCKAAELGFIRLQSQAGVLPATAVFFNLSTQATTTLAGSPTGIFVNDAGDGWLRVGFTVEATGAGNGDLAVYLDDDNVGGYTGDGTSGIYVWGAQLEEGSFPTSYIPTTGSAATRAAENPIVDGDEFNAFYNEDEWSAVVSFDPDKVPEASALFLSFGDTFDDSVYLWRSGDNIRLTIILGGVQQASPSLGAFPSGSCKVAISVKDADFRGCINGGTVFSGAAATLPTVNNMAIGRASWGASNYSNTTIERVTYFGLRLTDAQLQEASS